MGGKAVPKGVVADPFGDPGAVDGDLDGFLEAGFEDVMAAFNPAAGIRAAFLAGNTYCQRNSLAALVYFRARAGGR